MKWIARTLIILISVAEVVVWIYLSGSVWQLGNAFGGSGDGAGVRPGADGELLVTLIIDGARLFVASPYICMVLGSMNLVTGRALRITYLYSLIILSVMTLILFAYSHWIPPALMAIGNIVAGGLWAFYFRAALNSPGSSSLQP